MLNIIAALLVFGVIVFIHELGHFLFAKANGIGVVEFSLGMGPRLCSFKKGETRYSIKAFPLGGSCMMLGEDTDNPDEKAFQNKSVMARIATIAAGPIFNFILAYIFAVILVALVGFDEPVIKTVSEGTPAYEAGLEAGDTITALNGKSVHVGRAVSMHLSMHGSEPISVRYERNDPVTNETTVHNARITPQYFEDLGGYKMGISFAGYQQTQSVWETLKAGFYEIKFYISSTIDGFKMMFRGKVKAQDAVAGPIQIVNMIGSVVEESKNAGISLLLLNLMNLSMILSVSLGFMNLLPIPALDGGRLIFLFIEAVRGKPIDREKEGMVHMAGFMLLMALMVFVIFNDIRKIF